MSESATRPEPDEGITEATEARELEPSPVRSWGNAHPINIRVSIPLLVMGRFYITLLSGRERRGGERRRLERERHPLLTFANMTLLFIAGFIGGGACWIVLQTLMAWILGLNDA